MSAPANWIAFAMVVALTPPAHASGHGPVFGAATPTLGRGGWSVDQGYTFRSGDHTDSQQTFKTMVAFGITETVQVSASIPIAMRDGLAPSRMMSAMSSEGEFEALLAYRFPRRMVGVGGRQESTLYLGGTLPIDDKSLRYLPHDVAQQGDSRFVTLVYGYRPRRYVWSQVSQTSGSLLRRQQKIVRRYKAIAIEARIRFPVRQPERQPRERFRAAVNFAYFFWLK